jgi:hypothetical protein
VNRSWVCHDIPVSPITWRHHWLWSKFVASLKKLFNFGREYWLKQRPTIPFYASIVNDSCANAGQVLGCWNKAKKRYSVAVLPKLALEYDVRLWGPKPHT